MPHGTRRHLRPPPRQLKARLNLRKEACQHFTRQIESSPDPEIRLWPSYRSREKAGEGKAKKAESAPTNIPKPMMRLEDFRAAILSAVAAKPDLAHLQLPDFHKEVDREDRVVDHIDLAQKKALVAVEIWKRTSANELPKLMTPVGSIHAYIGIVLDHILPGNKNEESLFSLLPWGIKESGFNLTNSLIWIHNLRYYGAASLFQQRAMPISAGEFEALRDFNCDLIQQSRLKVIILCGSFDPYILIPKNTPSITIDFEGFNFNIFLEVNAQCITRIYAQSPTSIQVLLENKWRHARQIGILFRFAALITGTPGIWASFQSTAITTTEIVRLYSDERLVSPETRSATTIDTLSSSIRFWLYTKGFKRDEDIVRLQERGSSLAEALLMLMTLLPYRPAHIAGSSQKKTMIPSLTKRRGVFERDKLEHVKSLLVELNADWFPERTYSKTRLSILEKEINTDDPNAYFDVPEEHIGEVENTLMQVSSEGPLGNSTIEAAKEVRVRRILDAEMQLAEDPDAILEMAEEQLNETDNTPLHGLIQSPSRMPGGSSMRNIVSEPVFKSRMQLLNGGRYHNGCRRQNLRVDIYLPMNIIATINVNKYPEHRLLVRAELKQPGERHPNCWARNVLDSDTGARLAITITREEGDRFITVYATNNGYWAPYKANTFVDWLNGIGYVQISQTPRRYLHFQLQLLEGLPEELRYFVNGGYTDDKGVKFKNESERKSRM